ncbi:hypothetical protein KCU85_g27, partial [Aureobasidium melanogenum]
MLLDQRQPNDSWTKRRSINMKRELYRQALLGQLALVVLEDLAGILAPEGLVAVGWRPAKVTRIDFCGVLREGCLCLLEFLDHGLKRFEVLEEVGVVEMTALVSRLVERRFESSIKNDDVVLPKRLSAYVCEGGEAKSCRRTHRDHDRPACPRSSVAR